METKNAPAIGYEYYQTRAAKAVANYEALSGEKAVEWTGSVSYSKYHGGLFQLIDSDENTIMVTIAGRIVED